MITTRETLETEALSLFKDNDNIAIQAATGVGKSKIAITLANSIITDSSFKILLVVAEVAHKKNWQEEIIKWHLKDCSIVTVCYASLKKYINSHWDLIIFDEAHHLQSQRRLDIFSSLYSQKRIFLSATLKDSLINTLKYSCGEIVNIKMGLQEAFSSNILPEPKIILVPLKLNDTEKNHIITESWGKKYKQRKLTCLYKDRWKYLRARKLIPDAELLITCSAKQKYDYISEKFDYYKKLYLINRNEAIKNKWLQCGSLRKRFLGQLKTAVAKNLIETLKDKRFICFCSSIEQAEYLGKNNAIHSKNKASLETIQKFNNGEIDNLFAVGMLQEGQNLKNIEAGVIIQLDGEERSFIQKFGRTLRADSPLQYIIYYEGTRDEEYLKSALENIDPKYITKYVDYEHIN